MKCKYCQPSNQGFCNDLGANLLLSDEIHVAVNAFGYLEVDIDINSDIKVHAHKEVKINYCPMCGRKLKERC